MRSLKDETKKKKDLQLEGEEREIGVKIGFFSYARKKIFRRVADQAPNKILIGKGEEERRPCNSSDEICNKPILTIADILCCYCSKEDIQDFLLEYGEKTSGTKDELISRFLESKKVRSKDVNVIARSIFRRFHVTDLRTIGSEYGLDLPNKKDEICKVLLDHFNFEPYVDIKKLPCDYCNSNTKQEIHFKYDWSVAYFQCLNCGMRINPSAGRRNPGRND